MKFISYSTDAEGHIDITVPPEMAREFRLMVRRACATWQDMSPDMRHFYDRLLGFDKLANGNMKEGHETEGEQVTKASTTRTRDCCHTMLTEPHHCNCPEKDKVASYVKPELATASKLWPRTKSG